MICNLMRVVEKHLGRKSWKSTAHVLRLTWLSDTAGVGDGVRLHGHPSSWSPLATTSLLHACFL